MQITTADVINLSKKCGTLMASDVHKIPLFSSDFMNKLFDCTHPFLFKVYLLPYMSWFDYEMLIQLINFIDNKESLKLVDRFVNSFDYSKQITSYHIPEFSQLVIPLDDSQYTMLATKHIDNINKLILEDVRNIEMLLIKKLEITDYAIQLVAKHSMSSCLYWLVPNQIRPLVEDNLNKGELKLWGEGIVLVTLLPVNFCWDDNISQQNINNLFDVNSEDQIKVSF